MTADELKRLRELCDAATPGPWQNDNPGISRHWSVDDACQESVIELRGASSWSGCDHRLFCKSADGDLIATARTALPALLDEVERLEFQFRGAADLNRTVILKCDKLRADVERLSSLADRAYSENERLRTIQHQNEENWLKLRAENTSLKEQMKRLVLATERDPELVTCPCCGKQYYRDDNDFNCTCGEVIEAATGAREKDGVL
jgi:hypothetical protein